MILQTALPDLMPGQLIARGAARHLSALGFSCVEEFVPARGLRLDILALGPKGE
ncbi:MAG: MmcB family DNA repair protein, partial [Rhodosalinus sp.]